MSAPRILIIAYGNPLRCDDGLAWCVAEELSRLSFPSDVEIVTSHQLTPELALPVSEARTVIFIDAARAGAPGEITSKRIEPAQTSAIFTHEFSPSTILNIAQELYGGHPEAFAVSLCGECFDHGEVLSTNVPESIPRLVVLVRELITEASYRDPRATGRRDRLS